jgi:hypothetical protein
MRLIDHAAGTGQRPFRPIAGEAGVDTNGGTVAQVGVCVAGCVALVTTRSVLGVRSFINPKKSSWTLAFGGKFLK